MVDVFWEGIPAWLGAAGTVTAAAFGVAGYFKSRSNAAKTSDLVDAVNERAPQPEPDLVDEAPAAEAPMEGRGGFTAEVHAAPALTVAWRVQRHGKIADLINEGAQTAIVVGLNSLEANERRPIEGLTAEFPLAVPGGSGFRFPVPDPDKPGLRTVEVLWVTDYTVVRQTRLLL